MKNKNQIVNAQDLEDFFSQIQNSYFGYGENLQKLNFDIHTVIVLQNKEATRAMPLSLATCPYFWNHRASPS